MLPFISIISPVYRAEPIIDELVVRIVKSIEPITTNFEIILVDDLSPDNSWKKIEENCIKDSRVKGIKLSRNFGQHYAITAGIDKSKGDWIVVMDCDLQDQPEEIVKLYNKALEGFDVVLAQRVERKDTFLKKLGSSLFYKSLSYLTGTKQDASIANFGIYSKKVIDAIKTMRESIRYFPTMVNWVGFKKIAIEINHAERSEGTTSYNLKKLLNLALDIILAYSDKPLRLTIKLGLIVSASSFCFGIFYIIKWLLGDIQVLGYTSLILAICFFSGCIIAVLGIVGLYIGKIFEGVKNRPIYIIDKEI
jgi:polyisoprenyl-phosphate glycosyltransferase